jgi:hypothetical protein
MLISMPPNPVAVRLKLLISKIKKNLSNTRLLAGKLIIISRKTRRPSLIILSGADRFVKNQL